MAAELIEAYLQEEPIHPAQSRRLRHVRFPLALDWLQSEDVIRLAQSWSGESASRRAFFSRWPTRAEFLPDAVVYTLLREQDALVPARANSVSRLITGAADDLLAELTRHPRSYLILHLGPLLPRHPHLSEALLPSPQQATRVWLDLYRSLANGLDLVMRPEWTFKRMAAVLQALLDGFLLRHRVHPDDYASYRWKGASILADAIIAFLLGAVDWDLSGQPGRAALDTMTRG
ncbi:hypothetical protein [Actinophytocola sediminis]